MANPSTLAATSDPLLSVGAVVRLTGLSEHVLRAWERRYQAVVPIRTPGGTRRYRESDVIRLRLLRDAIGAGNRIGDIARLENEELGNLAGQVAREESRAEGPLREALSALSDFDLERATEIVSLQLSALGPRAFIENFVSPLMQEVGEAWRRDAICVASEHLATTLVRGALDSALRIGSARDDAPTLLFATPAGEHHEIGLLSAAIISQSAGARVLYLGADLPSDEIASAAARSGAQAVVLSLVNHKPAEASRLVREIREQLASGIDLWVGGSAARPEVFGIAYTNSFAELEQRVRRLMNHAGGAR